MIRHLDTGLHKIGITNDWYRRQKELEVGTKTQPVHVVRVNDARQIESFLHRRFKAKRMPQSEWFQLSEEQLEFVRTTVLKARDDHQHQAQPSAAAPTRRPVEAQQKPVLAQRSQPTHAAPPSTPPQAPRQSSGTPDWVTEGLDAVGAISFATVAMVVLLSPLFIWMNSVEQKAQQQREQAQRLVKLQDQNKQAVLDQAKKVEAEIARQAAAEQAEREREESVKAAAINRYGWFLQKVEAYDCHFYVWSNRAGDPTVYFRGFSGHPDATNQDDSECSPPVSKTSSVVIPISEEESFIRDKLLSERGQMPPERMRLGPNTAYRLDWPDAQ